MTEKYILSAEEQKNVLFFLKPDVFFAQNWGNKIKKGSLEVSREPLVFERI